MTELREFDAECITAAIEEQLEHNRIENLNQQLWVVQLEVSKPNLVSIIQEPFICTAMHLN